MDIIIKGCNDCPFIYTAPFSDFEIVCQHPGAGQGGKAITKDGRGLAINQAYTPDWCPLKREDCVVKMEKK